MENENECLEKRLNIKKNVLLWINQLQATCVMAQNP